MRIKFNLDKIMKENGISLNWLAQNSELDINTIRKIKNSSHQNPRLESLLLLAEALDCSIHDLVDDAYWKVYYDITLERFQHDAVFKKKQFFSMENLSLLETLFSKIGMVTEMTPSCNLKTVYIRNKRNIHAPIYFDITLRINSLFLEVIDLYIYVDTEVVEERNIKDLVIQSIEIYANRNNIDQIIFYNINGKDSNQFEHFCEVSLSKTTYQSEPEFEMKILKDSGFTLHKSPFFPLIGDTWSKLMINVD
ncbi:helix-turn-helix domain-containing protein [Oceanobacillus neutriphilus]|uniref:HTH cro/C1-type domain-containing protein n=1 Tax=Oceanobacillus neutriphilus TaxID=531815 RepID=A0ABQ2P351_9BACI|nr:helix-turn-helix domain-containing protein [Oceanobacillus neutriphilus]GGP17115.1 hypothetical protein GCM10011346_51780 [Oceanobacillus neutriphilus]